MRRPHILHEPFGRFSATLPSALGFAYAKGQWNKLILQERIAKSALPNSALADLDHLREPPVTRPLPMVILVKAVGCPHIRLLTWGPASLKPEAAATQASHDHSREEHLLFGGCQMAKNAWHFQCLQMLSCHTFHRLESPAGSLQWSHHLWTASSQVFPQQAWVRPERPGRCDEHGNRPNGKWGTQLHVSRIRWCSLQSVCPGQTSIESIGLKRMQTHKKIRSKRATAFIWSAHHQNCITAFSPHCADPHLHSDWLLYLAAKPCCAIRNPSHLE